MSGFVVVDASIWVARLVSQDAFHDASRSWLDEQRSAGVELLSPSFLLAEVAGAISRRTGDAQLARRSVKALENLPGLRLVAMGRSLVGESAGLAARLGLRGRDSFYVAVAYRLGVSLATLDRDQCERAASIVSITGFQF